ETPSHSTPDESHPHHWTADEVIRANDSAFEVLDRVGDLGVRFTRFRFGGIAFFEKRQSFDRRI
ncbi:MAG: hypothetical protein O3A00_27965, partial [Planctomycetota bacterium]|nr:hypothetical protein [Planctomycetota bacterium]